MSTISFCTSVTTVNQKGSYELANNNHCQRIFFTTQTFQNYPWNGFGHDKQRIPGHCINPLLTGEMHRRDMSCRTFILPELWWNIVIGGVERHSDGEEDWWGRGWGGLQLHRVTYNPEGFLGHLVLIVDVSRLQLSSGGETNTFISPTAVSTSFGMHSYLYQNNLQRTPIWQVSTCSKQGIILCQPLAEESTFWSISLINKIDGTIVLRPEIVSAYRRETTITR